MLMPKSFRVLVEVGVVMEFSRKSTLAISNIYMSEISAPKYLMYVWVTKYEYVMGLYKRIEIYA
jgi:hypothetical protein